MKVFCILLLLFLATIPIKAQTRGLLQPSEVACAEAERLGAKVFKILPYGLLKFDARENQLLLRGGGAHYSFTTGSHNYNEIPQISAGRDSISVGFAGFNYGFIIDLGTLSLNEVSTNMAELKFLSEYTPPNLMQEIRSEQRKSAEYKANGYVYRRRLPYVVGNTYALRAISYEEADVLVGFTVVSKDEDNALDIVWKTIETFDKPDPWWFTDEEIREKLPELLSNPVYGDISATVKDNVITLTGTAGERVISGLRNRLQSLRTTKIIIKVTPTAPTRPGKELF